MDFVTLLRRDQEQVSTIYIHIVQGFHQPDTPQRHELFQELKRALELHAAVEDLHVYRVFQQSESTRDAAHDALEAHAKIKLRLDQLDTTQAYDQTWVQQFQELQQLVEAHMAMEEQDLLRKAEEVMTLEEAEEFGVAVASAKYRISHYAPTREGGTPEDT